MKQAYEGAPETTFLVTPTPMGGEVYSVMRIIRNPGVLPPDGSPLRGPTLLCLLLGRVNNFSRTWQRGPWKKFRFSVRPVMVYGGPSSIPTPKPVCKMNLP